MLPSRLRRANLRSIVLNDGGVPREPTLREYYHLRRFQMGRRFDPSFLIVDGHSSWLAYSPRRVTIHHAYDWLWHHC